MVRRVLGVLARGVLIFAVVWLVVIGYWQYTRRVVSSSELIVYLGLLPLGLLLGYWMLKGMISLGKTINARRRQKADAQANAAQPAGNLDEAGKPPAEQPLLVLASALASGLGDAETWIERTRNYEVHHALDGSLSDTLGWPLRSIRLSDLDEADDASGDETWIAMQPGVRRMARMLERVQDDLSGVLRSAAEIAAQAGRQGSTADKRAILHPEWTGQPTPDSGPETAAPVAPVSGVNSLAVHLVLPGFVSESEAGTLRAASLAWASQSGWLPEAVTVTVARVEHGRAALTLIGELVQQQVHKPARMLVLLSAVSWLDDNLLSDQLQSNPAWAERLRKSATIVGEAAAGMVLANQPLVDPETRESSAALARLSRLTVGERQKPVDAKGTVDAELLDALSQGLVRAYGIDPAQVRRVVATGDLGSGRPVELGKWLTDYLPHLSLVDDSIQVGQHLGECDPVSDLVALVLAVESCREVEAPVLYCSNHSSHWRGLSAILPVAQAA